MNAAAAADDAPVKSVEIVRTSGFERSAAVDLLSVEEPLEIHVTSFAHGEKLTQPVAVTMRTPGADEELAAGFLFTEGIINSPDDIDKIVRHKCNVVLVQLKPSVQVDPALFERHSFVASSCGVCGKKSIEAVNLRRNYMNVAERPMLSEELVHRLPALMREAQSAFDSTGGIHASALFDAGGSLVLLREDVGRHNALDKVIGAKLLEGALPLADSILLVSGRASFELVQKAAHAGIAVLAAVGAPSSLAVSLAQESGMTLLGFVRDDRFNIYCGAQRIV
jgi:FdhD protein